MHAIAIDVLGCKATPQKSAEEVRMEELYTAMRLDLDKIILNCANDRMETAARVQWGSMLRLCRVALRSLSMRRTMPIRRSAPDRSCRCFLFSETM